MNRAKLEVLANEGESLGMADLHNLEAIDLDTVELTDKDLDMLAGIEMDYGLKGYLKTVGK